MSPEEMQQCGNATEEGKDTEETHGEAPARNLISSERISTAASASNHEGVSNQKKPPCAVQATASKKTKRQRKSKTPEQIEAARAKAAARMRKRWQEMTPEQK